MESNAQIPNECKRTQNIVVPNDFIKALKKL